MTRERYVDEDGDCRRCGFPADNSSGHGTCDSPAHDADLPEGEPREPDDDGLTIEWDGLAIVSGEGTGEGHAEPYTGARTLRALKAKLTREWCGGDRWAFARAADGTRYTIGGAS